MEKHYDRLGVPPSASIEEIKRAFRDRIARCHPDKVLHLAPDRQRMAAAWAAELTAAYRALSTRPPDSASEASTAEVPPRAGTIPVSTEPSLHVAATDLVVKAALSRLREVLRNEFGAHEETPARGFDVVCTLPKIRRWQRARPPVILGQVVPTVDAATVSECCERARLLLRDDRRDVCVVLLGWQLLATGDRGGAVDLAGLGSARMSGRMTVVPGDVHTWSFRAIGAPLPFVAPLLDRLRVA